MKKERIAYLDLLRVIAICAVVMIHASANFVAYYPSESISFILGNLCDSLSTLGVPLFLMISGTFMLDEQRTFSPKKTVLPMVGLFLLWSFCYALVYSVVTPIAQGGTVSLTACFTAFLRGHYHLWYMWAIIGLYLITPILRSFVTRSNKKIVLYFIVLSLLFQFTAPLIRLLLTTVDLWGKSASLLSIYTYVFGNLNLDFLGGLTTYYLAGWYIANTEFDRKSSVALYLLGFLSAAGIVLLTQRFPTLYDCTYSAKGLLVFFYCIAVFLLAKHICKPERKSGKLLSLLSRSAFGVYVIHVFVLTDVSKLLLKNVYYMPLVWFVTLVLSFCITFVLSKIPLVKKAVKA